MPEPEYEKKAKSNDLLGRLGWFRKALLFIGAIGFIAIIYFSGQITSIYQFIFWIFVGGFFLIIMYFAVSYLLGAIKPAPFSPTQDYFTKLVNSAKMQCPPSIEGKSLFLIGDERTQGFSVGSISGYVKIPYTKGKLKIDEKGKPIIKLDEKGKPTIKGDKGNPVFETLPVENGEGDGFFVVKKGGLLGKFMYVRAHQSLHSPLVGDVFISTCNLVQYGKYHYPFQQYQQFIDRIMKQNMDEVIITTFEYQHDLISLTTDDALNFNPYWQLARRQGTEQLATPNQ